MPEVTTVQLRVETLKKLGRYRDPVIDRNWDAAIERLLQNDGDIYIDILAVDGKLTKTTDHEVLVQVGNDPPNFHYYYRGKFAEVALPELDLITSAMRSSILSLPTFVKSQ